MDETRSSAAIGYQDAIKRVGAVITSILVFALCAMQAQTAPGRKFNIRIASSVSSIQERYMGSDVVQRATVASSSISMIPDPPLTTPPLVSKFEKLWPGFMLPPWAKKAYNYEVPPSQSMCFVHVGKAGGSAVGCSLGFSLHCGNTTQIDGILPKITTTVFHKDMYNCNDNVGHYLFVVRDPIERARSAFNYDRPGESERFVKNRYTNYYDACSFWTIEG